MIKDNLFFVLTGLVILLVIFGMATLFAFLSGGGFLDFWIYVLGFSFCAALGWISGSR